MNRASEGVDNSYMLGDREYGYWIGRITFMGNVPEILDDDEQYELANEICALIDERIKQAKDKKESCCA